MTATVGFLSQPHSDQSTLAALLKRALTEADLESLTIVVAWARFRGLARLQPEIEAFRARGGKTQLIVGIDEGGATRPGLLLAASLFDQAHVFHDPAGGTFHPKIYLVEGARRALLVVGSSNATPGGWFNNYEASLEARFALPDDAAHPALSGARDYIEALLAEEELCFALSEDLVDRLVKDHRYRVSGHERSRPSGTVAASEDRDQADLDMSGSTDEPSDEDRVFGARRGRRTYAPPLSTEAKAALAALEIPPNDEVESDEHLAQPAHAVSRGKGESAEARLAPTRGGPVKTWSKVLPRGDAQQQTASNTNVTANVRLTKAKHDIDSRTWFRDELFSTARWRKQRDVNGNPIELADVPFLVTIDGAQLGTMTLEVTHAPHRESKQHNHTTVLRWGPLQDTMRATNYTDRTLTLERMSNDTYRLDIS
jgi:PLD-like domain